MPGPILQSLFGRFSWTPPGWLQRIGCAMRRRPWSSALLLLVLVSALAGYLYYQQLPQPLSYTVTISAPGPASIGEDQLHPQPLLIHFRHPVAGEHSSVAAMALLDRSIAQGIALSPAHPGEWRWQDEATLRFDPQQEWPADQAYTVQLQASLFRDGVRLADKQPGFHSAAFTAQLDSLSFYQHPEQRDERRVLASLSFSHPVNEDSLKQQLRLLLRPSGADTDTTATALPYQISLDAHGRIAHIQTAPLTLPEHSQPLRLELAAGLRAAHGPGKSAEAVHGEVQIPDRYSLFKVSDSALNMVRNQDGDPQQVLTLGFTDDLDSATLAGHLQAWVLPPRRPAWRSPREVNEEVLARATPLPLHAIPNPREAESRHSFRLDAPAGRHLYFRISAPLASAHDFVMAQPYDQILGIPDYPRELGITNEGSVLLLSGEQRLGLLARHLEQVQVRIGRVLPGQLNHLVSQSHGDISNPIFSNYQFREENISVVESHILDLAMRHPASPIHAAVDLRQALQADDGYGLFFVEVQGWDKRNQRPMHGVSDKRLILLTDLGVIAKDNQDGTRELFIQSLRTGQPVAGAHVELLGKNGLAVFYTQSDARGHVRLPSTQGLTGPQQPIVYLVRHGEDLAFLPFERHQRQLNFSRFDVGGQYVSPGHDEQLSAFLFSERGIYRPGDTVHLGGIVRQQNLALPPTLPVELEIRNPRGTAVLTRRFKLPEAGLFEQDYASEAAGETGRYQVALYLIRDAQGKQTARRSAQIGTASFEIEEFQPDTLRIHSRLPGSVGKAWVHADQLSAEIKLENLFGSPAQDRRVSATMTLRPTGYRFTDYADYRFDDPTIDPKQPLREVRLPLDEQRTDADGLARFGLPLEEYRHTTYQLVIDSEGYEPGEGRHVSASSSALISPLEYLIGYRSDGRLDFIHRKAERRVHLIAIDARLQAIAPQGLRLQRLSRQQIATLVRQPNGAYQYQSVPKETLLNEEAIEIGTEGSEILLDSTDPGDFILQVVDPADTVLARIPYSVVGSANLGGVLDRQAELRLRLDRADYRAGEEIELNITAPYTGAGLITIESDRVHAFRWFRSDTQSSMQRIRVPEGLEGNAYVNVSFVRAVDSPEIHMSPLSYAVAPFTIDRSRRVLPLSLDAPARARPGEPFPIRYQAPKDSRLLVFAVDEGILQVADYATPQPLDHFLRKRALQVRTQQMLDLLLPEYRLLAAPSASGGGMMARSMAAEALLGGNLNPFARKVAEAVVFWSGVIHSDGQAGELLFEVPEHFNGELRIMAVAVSDKAMASAEQRAVIRAPFVLTPNVLTVAAPGDTFEVSLGVANMLEGSGEQLPLEIRLEHGDGLEVISERSHQLKIDEGSEARVGFTLRALDNPGAVDLRFFASHGEGEGQLISRIGASLSLRPAVPFATTLQAGRSSGRITLNPARQLHAEFATQQLAASASPLVLTEGLLHYLEHFPHQCTEQLVSQVFPLIGLGQHAGYADRRDAWQQQVQQLLQRLRSRQQADGSFVLWPGQRQGETELSLYLAHFLLAAREQGHTVPQDMLNPLLNYLRQLSRQPQQDREQAGQRAAAIYLLTRHGEVVTNQLVHLHERMQAEHGDTWHGDLSRIYMAASYRLLRDERRAAELSRDYRPGNEQGRVHPFHSALSQDAQYLYLLARHFPERLDGLPESTLSALWQPILDGDYNTISSAWAILALGAYGQAKLGPGGQETITFSQQLDAAWQALPQRSRPFPSAAPSVAAEQLRIEGEGVLFHLFSQAGFDTQPAPQAVSERLEIRRELVDGDGNILPSTLTPALSQRERGSAESLRDAQIRVGQELTIRLRLRSLDSGYLNNIAVIDLLPGGFEVVRESLPREQQIGIMPMPRPGPQSTIYPPPGGWAPDYVDIREDRVVLYGSFGPEVTTIEYRVRATAAGEFVVPGAYAEGMYQRNVRAIGAAGRLQVSAAQP